MKATGDRTGNRTGDNGDKLRAAQCPTCGQWMDKIEEIAGYKEIWVCTKCGITKDTITE